MSCFLNSFVFSFFTVLLSRGLTMSSTLDLILISSYHNIGMHFIIFGAEKAFWSFLWKRCKDSTSASLVGCIKVNIDPLSASIWHPASLYWLYLAEGSKLITFVTVLNSGWKLYPAYKTTITLNWPMWKKWIKLLNWFLGSSGLRTKDLMLNRLRKSLIL